MTRPSLSILLVAAACTRSTPSTTSAPAPVPTVTATAERPIHRAIPITNAIRRAYAAGPRDSSGRPGRNYWQLWLDYTINARLDPATSTIAGRERIVLRNTSDSALTSIVMRLDQN